MDWESGLSSVVFQAGLFTVVRLATFGINWHATEVSQQRIKTILGLQRVHYYLDAWASFLTYHSFMFYRKH